MRSVKAGRVTVELRRESSVIIASIGRDKQIDLVAGYGTTAPEALRDLAAAIQCEKRAWPELLPPAELIRIK